MEVTKVDPLWAELINSDWRDYRGGGGREDRIENPRWLTGFLARCGVSPRRLPGPRGREALRRFRAILRRSATARMNGRAPAHRDLEAINRCLHQAPLIRRIAAQGHRFALDLVPRTGGVRRALGDVAGSFAELLANGDPGRIKICANPDCGWFVYDESHNRSRRWCEAADCGNLMKVRRYRQRHRRTSDPARKTKRAV